MDSTTSFDRPALAAFAIAGLAGGQTAELVDARSRRGARPPSNLAGATIHHAFVTLGVTLGSIAAASTGSSSAPAPSPALATFASNALPLSFVP